MVSARTLDRGVRLGASARFLAALGLGVFAEALLHDAPVGWLYAVFAGGLILGALVFSEAKRLHWSAAIVAVAGLVALFVAPHGGSFTLAVLGVLGIAVMAHANVARDAWQWMRAMGRFVLRAPVVLFRRIWSERTALGQDHPRFAWRGIIGWALPVALAGIFALLFMAGNPLFAEAVDWGFEALLGRVQVDLVETGFATLRIVLIALLCWPFLRPSELEIAPSGALRIAQTVSIATVLRTLLLCNLLFGVQNFLDVVYLWGDGTLPEAVTYSDYAHQGIYPLALAAVLVGIIVLFGMPAGGDAEKHPLARGLVFLWLVQTGLLTLSCLKRLDLYVSVYSLTYLRVFAVIVTAAIGIGLIWIFIRVAWRRSNAWLVTVSTLTGLGMLFIGSVADIGARIAWYNVEHSRDVGGPGVHLDIHYLRSAVGPSAIPALMWFEANEDRQPAADGRLRRLAPMIKQMRERFEAPSRDWRAWTVRRHLIAREIASLER